MVREKSGLPPTPRELKVRTPAHRKQLGWYAELEPRVTQAATHYRAHRSPAPRLPSRHRRCRCARGGRSRRASPGTSHRPRAGSGPLQPRPRFFWGGEDENKDTRLWFIATAVRTCGRRVGRMGRRLCTRTQVEWQGEQWQRLVILLQPPLPRVGVSIVMERGRQQIGGGCGQLTVREAAELPMLLRAPAKAVSDTSTHRREGMQRCGAAAGG